MGPTVGVNVQDLLFWRNESKKVLADTLDTLSTEKGATIIFLPFGSYKDGWVNREKSNVVDMTASKKLAALMKGNTPLSPTTSHHKSFSLSLRKWILLSV